MGQKAKNGGALGQAKFSHLSVRDTIDGRESARWRPIRNAPRLCSWL
jgi:hypothetical protein